MKSNVCKLSKGIKESHELGFMLDEVEKVAAYNELEKKDASTLRLLAEEVISMLPELLSFSNGDFWVENDKNNYELHVKIFPDEKITSFKEEELLKISSKGKNEAGHGIMNKIRLTIQMMLTDYKAVMNEVPVEMETFYEMGTVNISAYQAASWSLDAYKEKAQTNKNKDWDELEKSIIANIADDVLVSAQNKEVEIIIKKSF